MTFTKPDGVIELEASGCCCPPGAKRGGIHTRGFTHWYRVLPLGQDNPNWQADPNQAATHEAASASATVAEFVNEMIKINQIYGRQDRREPEISSHAS
jgi:hypothetical protein